MDAPHAPDESVRFMIQCRRRRAVVDRETGELGPDQGTEVSGVCREAWNKFTLVRQVEPIVSPRSVIPPDAGSPDSAKTQTTRK